MVIFFNFLHLSVVLHSVALILSTAGSNAQVQNMHTMRHRRDQSIPNGPLYPEGWPFMSNCLDPTSSGGILDTSLPSCNGGESDISKNDKIAIIGAGPAGISMAYLLKKRGFHDITIFEKEDRVGGKSKNVEFNGDKFDVGTIYSANKYECVELLFDEFNTTEISIKDKVRFVTDPIINPSIPVSDYWYPEYTKAQYGIEYADSDEYLTAVVSEIEAYTNYWTASMGSLDYFFPDEETINFDDINVSFLEWMEVRGLYNLIPRFHIYVSAQGYGSLGEIPAFYGLMWIHPNFFAGGGSFSIVKQDWQTLWERVIDSLGLNVILEANIDKIHRNDNRLNILYSVDDEAAMMSTKFDKLIMAIPMPDGLQLLHDATVEELDLFSNYNYKSLRLDLGNINDAGVLAAIGETFNTDVELFSWIGRMDQQTDYHVKSFDQTSKETSRFQWKTDGVDGILTIGRIGLWKQNVENPDVTGLFSVAPLDNLDDPNVITAEVQADLSSLGIDFEHIASNRQPDYMPWKNITDIVDGRIPWRIWDYQGTLNTWFVGSYASFESVADVLDYNLKLVNERLCED